MESKIINKRFKVLDKGFVELLEVSGSEETIINTAMFTRSSKLDNNPELHKELIKFLLENKHMSPFEMVETKFLVKCPIFVARQWMRHRTWSYAEISRRNSSFFNEFYIPDQVRFNLSKNSVEAINFNESIQTVYEEVNRVYELFIDNDVSSELSRIILPISLYTKFICKTDVRNLIHFLKLRLSKDAQYEIRQYADIIYKEIFPKILPFTANELQRFFSS